MNSSEIALEFFQNCIENDDRPIYFPHREYKFVLSFVRKFISKWNLEFSLKKIDETFFSEVSFFGDSDHFFLRTSPVDNKCDGLMLGCIMAMNHLKHIAEITL